MDHLPPAQKPKSALPSYLIPNTSSPLSTSHEARDKKEREKLYAAIEQSSTVGRQAVDLDEEPSSYFGNKKSGKQEMNGLSVNIPKHSKEPVEEEEARDPRDEVVVPMAVVSRPDSPFTQHPTIDFDGLSWPSEIHDAQGRAYFANSKQAWEPGTGQRLHLSKPRHDLRSSREP